MKFRWYEIAWIALAIIIVGPFVWTFDLAFGEHKKRTTWKDYDGGC